MGVAALYPLSIADYGISITCYTGKGTGLDHHLVQLLALPA